MNTQEKKNLCKALVIIALFIIFAMIPKTSLASSPITHYEDTAKQNKSVDSKGLIHPAPNLYNQLKFQEIIKSYF